MPKVIGLTGGIATGKSTVSELLTAYGFKVVDADIAAREAVKKRFCWIGANPPNIWERSH